MKIKKTLSAVTAAHHELLRGVRKSVIDAQLCMALHRARTWYALHGKKFTMPNDRKTER